MNGLSFTVREEKDANGNPIFEIDGERFYYVDEGKGGKGTGADHVWASARGAQMIWRGPRYEVVDLVPPLIRG